MAPFLIINSSPRRGGNCAFLREIAEGVLDERGVERESIDVARLAISPCTACDLCKDRKVEYCAIDDDMAGIYGKIAACESLLFLSPVYWFSYSAQLKLLVDRLYGLWNRDKDFLRGTKVGAVLVYGDADLYSSGGINAITTFEHMCRFTGAVSCGFAYGTANDIGDARKNQDLIDRTRSLARSMI